MNVATASVSILFAALLAFSAVRKLSHRPDVVQTYARAGVPEDKLNYLALTLFAGAAGLCVGLVWEPIGVAAALALVVYFLVAIAFHIRAGDAEHLPTPILMEVLAAAALVRQLT